MITLIYLVDDYGVAFKNKKDAAAFLREKKYNEQKLAYYKRAFGATYSEESIVYLINNKIREIELQ
tara:strand:- start:38 stop:235 length:198 start_codon:yes stop_codon:yes gene_type:complete